MPIVFALMDMAGRIGNNWVYTLLSIAVDIGIYIFETQK